MVKKYWAEWHSGQGYVMESPVGTVEEVLAWTRTNFQDGVILGRLTEALPNAPTGPQQELDFTSGRMFYGMVEVPEGLS
jgi:hypothetical protein